MKKTPYILNLLLCIITVDVHVRNLQLHMTTMTMLLLKLIYLKDLVSVSYGYVYHIAPLFLSPQFNSLDYFIWKRAMSFLCIPSNQHTMSTKHTFICMWDVLPCIVYVSKSVRLESHINVLGCATVRCVME